VGGLHLSLSLLGCVGREQLPARLPSEVSIVAREEDGDHVSILVPLRRNARHELDVRVADGVKLYDGEHLWAVEPQAGDEGWAIGVHDLLGQAQVRLKVGSAVSPTLRRIDRGRVWADVGAGHVVCDIQLGRCGSGSDPAPELAWLQEGPGAGFRVDLDDSGTLRLRLPIEADAEPGSILSTNIESVIAIRWVRTMLPLEREDLNRAFRGLGVVDAVATPIVVDGELDDWGGTHPLVVDAPWQVDSGMDGWGGARDGSFSIAASWQPPTLCLGGRVRDDVRDPADRLIIQVAGLSRELNQIGRAHV
jgi:hypothetical protein